MILPSSEPPAYIPGQQQVAVFDVPPVPQKLPKSTPLPAEPPAKPVLKSRKTSVRSAGGASVVQEQSPEVIASEMDKMWRQSVDLQMFHSDPPAIDAALKDLQEHAVKFSKRHGIGVKLPEEVHACLRRWHHVFAVNRSLIVVAALQKWMACLEHYTGPVPHTASTDLWCAPDRLSTCLPAPISMQASAIFTCLIPLELHIKYKNLLYHLNYLSNQQLFGQITTHYIAFQFYSSGTVQGRQQESSNPAQ